MLQKKRVIDYIPIVLAFTFVICVIIAGITSVFHTLYWYY